MLKHQHLSPKQRKFADAVIAGGMGTTEAAIYAGYSKRSAHVTASRMLKVAKVAAYIEAGKKAALARNPAVLTRQRSLELLAEIAEGKRKAGGKTLASDAVRAINESNKMQGFHEPERIEVTGSLVDRLRRRSRR